MAAHITRPSVLTGLTVYYKGGNQWTDIYADRKVYGTSGEADTRIAPTTRTLGNRQVSNANGTFKNATVVIE